MRVLYFTKYSRKGASSRLRSYQYFPFFESAAIQVTVKPLFDDAYLDKLYARKKISGFAVLKYYLSRFFTLFTVFRYDTIVIEKELFPYFFSWAERFLNLLGIKYIVDYDDAIFHNYDLSKNKIIKKLLSNKIDNVMKNSHCAVVGNSYLANRTQEAGAKNIVIIPTVIDVDAYTVKNQYDSNPVVIGWIGSPTTFKYLQEVMPVLENMIQKYDCRIHVVGTKEDNAKYHPNITFIDWNEKQEVSFIANFDIGVMPLHNTPWELGKCSYKLIQYMGCGLPVVASAVGMNNEVVEPNRNGFLFTNDEEFGYYLTKLIESSVLRKELGINGRRKIEANFDVKQKSQEWISILKS